MLDYDNNKRNNKLTKVKPYDPRKSLTEDTGKLFGGRNEVVKEWKIGVFYSVQVVHKKNRVGSLIDEEVLRDSGK